MASKRNSRAVTIQDVARAVGMSSSTVSLALNGKAWVSDATRDTVLRAANEIGYEPNYYAQRIRGGNSRTIALFSLDVSAGMSVAKIHAMQHRLSDLGWMASLHSLAFSSHERHIELLSTLRRQKPRAIIAETAYLCPGTLTELGRYIEEGGVVVTHDEPIELACDQVTYRQDESVRIAVRHLVGLGHKHIGLVAHGSIEPHIRARRAFQDELSKHQLKMREDWLWGDYPFEIAGGRVAERFLVQKEKPSGLIFINDVMAAAFLHRILRAGVRVPEDLSIVGHDDSPAASHAMVKLTTVSNPVETTASTVVDVAIRRLHEASLDKENRVVPTKPTYHDVYGSLTVRESTGPFLKGSSSHLT